MIRKNLREKERERRTQEVNYVELIERESAAECELG